MEDEEVLSFIITEEDKDKFKRLDHYLDFHLENLSRSFIKGLFQRGAIFTSKNEKHCPQQKLELKKLPQVGTLLYVQIPVPDLPSAQPENIPLDILYEDEHLIFIDKPAGMVTHPAPGHKSGTLVNAILHHCDDLKGIGDQKRPGIVHRLDKGTSGVMVVAKTQTCHEKLVNIFSAHDLERKYDALAMGIKMPIAGTLQSFIARSKHNRLKMAVHQDKGKMAITHYKTLRSFDKLSHLELKLETGRTHQIRVHLSYLLKSPILCDPLYGNPKEHLQRIGGDLAHIIGDYPHPFLHAKLLKFNHPITNKKLAFKSPPPQIFQDVLKKLKEVKS